MKYTESQLEQAFISLFGYNDVCLICHKFLLNL